MYQPEQKPAIDINGVLELNFLADPQYTGDVGTVTQAARDTQVRQEDVVRKVSYIASIDKKIFFFLALVCPATALVTTMSVSYGFAIGVIGALLAIIRWRSKMGLQQQIRNAYGV